MKSAHTFAQALSRFITAYPGRLVAGVLLLVALAGWQASQLPINYDQLDLLPRKLPSVKSTREMMSILGGYGQLIVALRGDSEANLKLVADDLTHKLKELPEVRSAVCKEDVAFITRHLAYYIDQDDLKEAFGLFRKVIRQATRDSVAGEVVTDPQERYFKPFEPLVEKYRRVNNKEVFDDYHIDPKKEMVTIIIRAYGDANDLAFNKRLIDGVRATIESYSASNSHKIILTENYEPVVPRPGTLSYGFTGDYMRNLEDSVILQNALTPTSLFSFIGILIYLIILLRKPGQIMLIMTTLVFSVILTFGFAKIAIGELNIITAVLGAILLGFGIDYGIHFIYRFREEFTYSRNLEQSIEQTLLHSGRASFLSALTAGGAMSVLAFADFKGFAHFGIIAGTGIVITAFMMYTVLPALYCLIVSRFPSFTNNLILDLEKFDREDRVDRPYPYARRVLIASIIITAVFALFAFRVGFDYDSRSFMSGNSPSVRLLNEIGERFKMTGDPVAFYTDTEEETRALFHELKRKAKKSAVPMQIFSLYSLVPDSADQEKTRAVLQEVQERLEMLPDDLFKGEKGKYLELARTYLEVPPFTRDDVPPHLLETFRPDKKSGKQGYLTYVVPSKVLWDSRFVSQFAGELRQVSVKGKTIYGAGGAIVYSDLALIVLRDGKIFPLAAAVIILIIILIGYRDYRALVFAMVPLVAGMIWMLGLMGLTGWKINFVNIVVFPVAFGYGISNGIHIYNRFLESGSITYALRHTGGAVIGSSLTTLIGWGALLISNHNALISMGILAVFGISAALVVSFTVMPASIQVAIKVKRAIRDQRQT